MSPYRTAIDLTTQTIDKRAKYYRNLVVTVVFATLASIGWALVSWSLSPLSGLFLLFPICGLFFFIDARLLNEWRSQLFQHWAKKEIDFSSFCDAINAISILPKETLQAMLATLPVTGDIIAEQTITSSTRAAVASSIEVNHVNQSDAIAFKVSGFAIVVVSLILALALCIWQPLLGVAVVLILPLLQGWTRRWRQNKSLERVLSAQQQPDFNQEKYSQLVDELDRNSVSGLD
jgi:hypothetical protein